MATNQHQRSREHLPCARLCVGPAGDTESCHTVGFLVGAGAPIVGTVSVKMRDTRPGQAQEGHLRGGDVCTVSGQLQLRHPEEEG